MTQMTCNLLSTHREVIRLRNNPLSWSRLSDNLSALQIIINRSDCVDSRGLSSVGGETPVAGFSKGNLCLLV